MVQITFLFFVLSTWSLATTQLGCPPLLNAHIDRFGDTSQATALQKMANALLDHAPQTGSDVYQVAMPVNLYVNPAQPEQFGDGQKNAQATFGGLGSPAFIAILKRPADSTQKSVLKIVFSTLLPGFADIQKIDLSVMGTVQTAAVNSAGEVEVPLDISNLGWNQSAGATAIFFRPSHWQDWFAVQFPYPYLKNSDLVGGMAASSRTLPSGESIVDPLRLYNSSNVQSDLRNVPVSEAMGFELARVDRVHGEYLNPDGTTTLTSNGGVWTRYRIGDPFKIVYLVKDPRDLAVEKADGVVSGTGPHYVGATAEIILNSIEKEGLITFLGVANPAAGPGGDKLAWAPTHQWVGTWLRPGDAFVTPQGMFHWHLNHLRQPIAAQVLTPPAVPAPGNFHGFPKK